MSLSARRELLAAVWVRYAHAERKEKCRILDELVATTGYDRKHAIKLLSQPPLEPNAARRSARPRHRSPTYGPDVCAAFVNVWKLSRGLCPKRLVPFLQELVEALERHQEISLPPTIRSKLLLMSVATAERALQSHRRVFEHGISTTSAGTLLRNQIPIHTFWDWQESKPGFMEIDLVAHCGDTAAGQFAYTLTMTDISTGWTEYEAIPNRGQLAVLQALTVIRGRLPFPLLGVDSDNGAEFINYTLASYCEANTIQFTRGRPNKKNDQCHVEQKNGNVIRPLVGYARYEGQAAVDHLNRVYAAHRLHQNFFCPSMKLTDKSRKEAKVIKTYDKPQTPFQRLIGYNILDEQQVERLQDRYKALNPAKLVRRIEELEHGLRAHTTHYHQEQTEPTKNPRPTLPSNLFGKNLK